MEGETLITSLKPGLRMMMIYLYGTLLFQPVICSDVIEVKAVKKERWQCKAPCTFKAGNGRT